MSTGLSIAISAATMRALLDYHAEHTVEATPADLADLAIRDWLKQQKELARPAGKRGYLWKTLFLPEGTRLRISSHYGSGYAAIVGDELVYDAMTMSPNQFAQRCAGSVRNAWEHVRIQMPGEREWKLALHLRQAAEGDARLAAYRAFAAQRAGKAAEPPRPEPPARPQQTAALPGDAVFAPQLRPDRAERRHSYRRAEDLLLD